MKKIQLKVICNRLNRLCRRLISRKTEKEKNTMPKFDIIIRAEGCAEKTEQGVYASSAAELRQLYEMCGEQIEIVKQHADTKATESADNRTLGFDAPRISITESSGHHPQFSDEDPRLFVPPAPVVEKIIMVNGEQIKIVGDEVYRRLWKNYAETDPENETIRVVYEKTGKPIKMDGKIIQTKEWVLQ
jgi:hypothetical protein